MDNDLFTVKVKITLSLVCVHHTNESSFATRSEFNRLNCNLINDHWSDLFTSTFQLLVKRYEFLFRNTFIFRLYSIKFVTWRESLKLSHYNNKCNAYIKRRPNLLFISYNHWTDKTIKMISFSGIIWRSLIRYTLQNVQWRNYYETRFRKIFRLLLVMCEIYFYNATQAQTYKRKIMYNIYKTYV